MTEKEIEKEDLELDEMADTPEMAEESTDAVDEMEEKYAKLNDSYLRLLAEFDNYKKRTLREKAELIKSGGEGVLTSIIPFVDDFERAIDASKKAEDMTAINEGLDLIYSKLTGILSQNGMKAMDTAEQAFDTEFHEAITTIPAPNEALKGKIVDCVQKGYMLNDKVIRYAKVVVGE
jgi:molecular chaperone GrpE